MLLNLIIYQTNFKLLELILFILITFIDKNLIL